MATKEPGTTKELETLSVKDNFIPLFDGSPGTYREWRKRILIYSRKMQLQKREGEAVLNLLGSLQGSAWRILEDYDLDKAEEKGAMDHILATLDKSLQYDDKVELPADFSAYFERLSRRPGQTLLQFITEHDEYLRRIQKHGVDLPSSVQGWRLLSKANLSREQRQLIMTQTNSLERLKVQEAMFTILGQDYKAAHGVPRWHGKPSGKGRAYYTEEPELTEEWDATEYGYFEDDDAEDDVNDFAWDDSEAVYYQDSSDLHDETLTEEAPYDVQEFDEAYASYVDARRRFQDLKMSRGFLPVVALQDPTSAASSNDRGQSPKGHGKSAGKSKGLKGKHKGKATVRYGKGPAKAADPIGRAKAALATSCLRCGSTAHKTAQCTQGSSPKANASGTKRQAVESVAATEHGLVIFEDHAGRERMDCAMLDPGASSFLMGYGPFLRYIEHLRDLRYPVEHILLKQADRTFFFGGDHQAKSNWTVHLPVFIKGHLGFIQGFLLKGETPMLLGRPVASELGLCVDFKDHQMRYDSKEDWRPCLLGRQGEYLIPLTEDFEDALIESTPGFDLILEEENGPDFALQDFLDRENVFVAGDAGDAAVFDDESTPLSLKTVKTLTNAVSCKLNEMQAYVTKELRASKETRPRLIWEVYTGESRAAQVAESLGAQTMSFGIRTGWNCDQRSDQLTFLELLEKEMPDEVYLSPTCSPWSRMQNISATTPERQSRLSDLREWHHRTHLRFVRRIYMKQISEGRHAHIEQPTQALSWNTNALRGLPGLHCRFHQCQYGCVCLDTDGAWKPVLKDTTILSSKQAMAHAMTRLCDHRHEHCQLEGHLTGFLSRSRTSYLEDYQPSLATMIATVLLVDEGPLQWSHGYAVAENHQRVGVLAKLHVEGKSEALRTVQRLHRGLGHPAPQALVELLQGRGASPTVIEVAANYQCTACLRYKRPNQPAPAASSMVKEFNQKLQADVMWIKVPMTLDRGEVGEEKHLKKVAILSMLDSATKYQAACVVPSEQAADLVKGIERHWVAHFGPPHCLLTDEGRGWASADLQAWAQALGVLHEVAPGEAHTRLSLVERRHAVLRKAIELYVDDMKICGVDAVKQALSYVVPQINAQPTVAGYSPCQWLFGYQPSMPGTLLSDRINPTHLSDSFEDTLYRRTAARTALLQADVDEKLRRALLRRYAGTNQKLLCGQLCYYWRDGRQADLVKIRWRGPARVLMVEEDHVRCRAWSAGRCNIPRRLHRANDLGPDLQGGDGLPCCGLAFLQATARGPKQSLCGSSSVWTGLRHG